MVSPEPTAECSDRYCLNSSQPLGSLFCSCTRVAPTASPSAAASIPSLIIASAAARTSARNASRVSPNAPDPPLANSNDVTRSGYRKANISPV